MSQEEAEKKDELVDTGEGSTAESEVADTDATAENSWPEDDGLTDSGLLLKQEQEKYLRLYSEFENFRKRTARERIEMLQLAEKDVILSVLPLLDDFERAIKAGAPDGTDASKVLEGFELIYKKFVSAMETRGLKAMNATAQQFDVELHEAVTKIPAPTPELSGKVVDEVEKGYMLNDKVIRFAKVVVGE